VFTSAARADVFAPAEALIMKPVLRYDAQMAARATSEMKSRIALCDLLNILEVLLFKEGCGQEACLQARQLEVLRLDSDGGLCFLQESGKKKWLSY
jgi:hypothetical protein